MLDKQTSPPPVVFSQKGSRVNASHKYRKKQNLDPYDERIIPTLMNKVKTEESQEANY